MIWFIFLMSSIVVLFVLAMLYIVLLFRGGLKDIKLERDIQQYDVVAPKEPHKQSVLHSGSNLYDFAVVLSVDPFILVSLEGDMRWNYQHKYAFRVVRTASTREIMNAQSRLDR